jgi:hypothetical protein
MRLRHSMTMSRSGWEEIHAFSTPGEYRRFVEYIQRQVALGQAEEVPVDPSYDPGERSGGRCFRDLGSGEVWRLIPPDPPFYGVWGEVRCKGYVEPTAPPTSRPSAAPTS